jgi:hypothetical protein
MAARKPAKRKRPRGDSPINIGGGGGKRKLPPYVTLEFDHNDYAPDPDDTDNFLNEDAVLASLKLNNVSVGTITRNSTIVIDYKKGGSTGQIILTGIPLGIRFNGKKLRYHLKKHRGDGWQLKTLTIDNDPSINLAAGDRVEVLTTASKRRGR